MITQISAQKSSLSSSLTPLPPLVPGFPVFGSALSMARNPLQFFLTQYHRYGPIFRVRVLNHECTVLGGLEVNQFLVNGDEVFPSKAAFAALAREYGTENLLPAMDGSAHLRRRRLQRRSYARERLYARMPELLHLTEEMLQGWRPGSEMAVFPALQRIIVQQLGLVLLNRPPQDAFDAVRTLVQFNLFVNILGFIPPLPLRWPAYQRAKARVIKLCAEIVEEHRAIPSTQRIHDLVDDLLEERDEDGNPYTDRDIIGEMMGSFFAGMDTVSGTCSFMLYAILKTPGLLAQVQEEIDQAFSSGSFDPRSLRTMPVLHATALETLRRYPIAPVTSRTVGLPFEFAGYRVEPGTRVFLVNGLTHFLPEYFPEPERFDIHHFDSDARKSRPANAFAPFALGAHTCLGAGLAEAQIMVLISILLHTFELALDPPGFEVKMLFRPAPTPGAKFRVKVLRRRH
ncbi:MAG TPA: cytochrome P450 [Ktedonobacteraceae bacterium]